MLCLRYQDAGSPEGTGRAVLSEAGIPKLGVPSAFQVNFCARVVRFMSHPPPVELLAWYTIQSSVPSGEVKNPPWPGA
jgi:hypothetical protein